MCVTKLSLRKCQTLQAEGCKETSGGAGLRFACSEAQVERRLAAAAWTVDPPPHPPHRSSSHTRFKLVDQAGQTVLFTSASFLLRLTANRRASVSPEEARVAETKDGRKMTIKRRYCE